MVPDRLQGRSFVDKIMWLSVPHWKENILSTWTTLISNEELGSIGCFRNFVYVHRVESVVSQTFISSKIFLAQKGERHSALSIQEL